MTQVHARDHLPEGPLKRAAERALETGDARHIIIWVPEESANTVRNLLERVCCEQRDNPHAPVTGWYFRTVARLSAGFGAPGGMSAPALTPEERRLLQLVDHACGSGDLHDLIPAVPDIPDGRIREQFLRVMEKRDFPVMDLAAGRDYAAAYAGLVALVVNRSRSR